MSEEEARAWLTERHSADALRRLERFVRLLLDEASRQNLIAASTIPEVWSRHIVDSAQLLDHLPLRHPGTWLDVGSGAGLPGLVAAILDPGRPVRLVEPRRRRAAWLGGVRDALGLAQVTIFHNRIERLEPFAAAVVSARAVMSLAPLITACAPFSTRETVWLLPKGASALQELAQLDAREQQMFHVEQSITDPDAQIIVGTGVPSAWT